MNLSDAFKQDDKDYIDYLKDQINYFIRRHSARGIQGNTDMRTAISKVIISLKVELKQQEDDYVSKYGK